MSDTPRDRGLHGLLLGLLLAMVAGLAWLFVSTEHDVPSTAPDPLQPDASAQIAGGQQVRLRGRLLLEGEREEDPLQPATTCSAEAWHEGVLLGQGGCDEDGNVEIVLPAAGRVSVALASPGRLRAMVTVDVPREGGVLPTVALGPAQTLRGQVLDGWGKPVVGVVVQARPSPDLAEPEPWRRTTDAQGMFSFDTLPPGPVALRCDADGYVSTVVEAIVPQDDVLLRLGGVHDVRGRVLLTEETQRARVRLEGSGVWPARVVEAGADGAFVVPQVPDGVYALEAIVQSADGGAEFASVPLEGVEPDLEVTLALVPAHRVSVRVEDPDGVPLSGARVTMMNAQIGMLSRTQLTDERGEASVGPVVPGPYIVRADGDGFLASVPEAVGVPLEDTEPIVLRLERPARIVASVVLPDGSAVKGATVVLETDAVFSVGEAQARAETFERTLVASGTLGVTSGPVPAVPHGSDAVGDAWRKSGESGRVVFRGLVPGLYRVHARHGDFASSAERELDVRGGGEATLTLTLREGQALTGRIRDANERPIEGAVLSVDGVFVARSDDRGVFDAGPHRGEVRLKVRAEGFAGMRRTVRVDEEPLDIELTMIEADGELSGRVLGPNERPLEGARISVHPAGGRGPSQQVWSDARGLWSIDGLPQGDTSVEVEHDDYVAIERRVKVEERTTLDVSLREGWTLGVSVRWQGTDEPVVGARVSTKGAREHTDDAGRATLDGLEAERVEIEIEAAGAPSTTRWVSRADAADDVRVELVEGGSVRGTVTDFRGDPVRGATVEVFVGDDEDPWASAKVGARGRFHFKGLPEGPIEVVAAPPAALRDDLLEDSMASDVLRGHVTRDVMLRLDRR